MKESIGLLAANNNYISIRQHWVLANNYCRCPTRQIHFQVSICHFLFVFIDIGLRKCVEYIWTECRRETIQIEVSFLFFHLHDIFQSLSTAYSPINPMHHALIHTSMLLYYGQEIEGMGSSDELHRQHCEYHLTWSHQEILQAWKELIAI